MAHVMFWKTFDESNMLVICLSRGIFENIPQKVTLFLTPTLYLSQFKLPGLDLPVGVVFIISAIC